MAESFTRTYVVDQSHPAAKDDNPGTAERPFKTINAAAAVVGPGERVLVHAGVYRERVKPQRGGEGSENMVTFEAAPNELVIIRGSEIYQEPWRLQTPGITGVTDQHARVWEIEPPENWFVGCQPFAAVNMSRYDDADEMHLSAARVKDPHFQVYAHRRGLIFQNGQRLKQVFTRGELAAGAGRYWVGHDGHTILVRPAGDVDPQSAVFELTAREQCFAPTVRYLGYMRVRGFVMEMAAGAFPRPQTGLLSASRGHHWIVEKNIIRHANAIGMDLGAQTNYEPDETAGNHIVRGNTVEHCGICGICANGSPENLLVENNILRGNCWHRVGLEESAAIKFHVTRGAMVRNNLITDTLGGSGIWMDWHCRNSRVTGNVILRTKTLFGGGIFVEASTSKQINMVDHNIIWEVTGNGIYGQDDERLVVAYNLIGRATNFGIHLGWSDVNRMISSDEGSRASTGRANVVMGNLLVENARHIELDNPDNVCDYNTYSPLGRDKGGAFRLRRPEENLDFYAWGEFYKFDLHSTRADVKVEIAEGEKQVSATVDGQAAEVPLVANCVADIAGAKRGDRSHAGPWAAVSRGSSVASIR